MIAQLRGRLAAVALGQVVLDVAGVGYRVYVPPGAVRAAVGDEVVLHTHLAVREDALTLFGFPEPAARDLYEVLLGVTGVGPKLALAAIGSLGAGGLRAAVVGEDVAMLTTVPGIGKKGAQRMILELREKLGALDDGAMPSPASGGPRAEVREALASLGYAPAEVKAALEAADADDGQIDDPEALLRAALRQLGGSRSGSR
jgi:holliday junction DNA helicase RuvA